MKTILRMPDPVRGREYFIDKLEFTTGPVELNHAMENHEVVVVDVRATDDFLKGHIPGAVSLPQEKWASAQGLSRNKANVLYCYSQVCHLAANAAVLLAEKGYAVMELEGGFAGWKDQHLSIETETMTASPPPART